MKIVVAGCGKVGGAIISQLNREDYDITVIDSDNDVLSANEGLYDVMVIHGNCAVYDVLIKAGIEDADLIIAVTGEDEINMLCAITAHCINNRVKTICRIRDPQYRDQAIKMQDIFSVSMIVNPDYMTAMELNRLLMYPAFLRRDSFASGKAEVVEIKIEEESKLAGVVLKNVGEVMGCRVLVCAVVRNGEVIMPDGNFELLAGDEVFVTASTNNFHIMLGNLGIITKKIKNVMLCGGGRISFYLAGILADRGINVKIIERDYKRCVTLSELLPKASVICGDATDETFLEEEGLEGTDAIVSLTGMDELNMVISLYANNKDVGKVFTKIGKIENKSLLGSLPLGSVISPKNLCAANILRYVRALRNQTGAAITMHKIANGMVEALEFVVAPDAKYIGEAIKDMHLKPGILIVGITHKGSHVIPGGNSSYRLGDHVIIVTTEDHLVYTLNDIFEG
ncbi:MAG: Trk system potassium transporter TrkA [Lachnospiraceae bacterium]|nr:Trk system potassium transporter TrkA [Lachnospiraceae bacterium]